jgi:hypothetical protein
VVAAVGVPTTGKIGSISRADDQASALPCA